MNKREREIYLIIIIYIQTSTICQPLLTGEMEKNVFNNVIIILILCTFARKINIKN